MSARLALCEHPDHHVRAFLLAVENGEIGAVYDSGRGNSLEPRGYETLESYSGLMGQAYDFNNTPWDQWTKEDAEAFINRPKPGGERRADNSIRQNRSVLRTFFRYLAFHGHITDNPMTFVRAPKQAPSEREPVPDHIWLKVWTSDLDPDDRLALGLGYFAGLRREEIVTVAPQAIDPLHRKIKFFRRKGGKTKQGLEYGELVEVLRDGLPHLGERAWEWVEMVESYARIRRDQTALLPDRGVKNPGQRFRDRIEHVILPGAGLPRDTFTPHNLRHSFGTNMALCQLPIHIIADQMSHSDTTTTEGYIHMAGQIGAWRRTQAPGGSLVRAARLAQ